MIFLKMADSHGHTFQKNAQAGPTKKNCDLEIVKATAKTDSAARFTMKIFRRSRTKIPWSTWCQLVPLVKKLLVTKLCDCCNDICKEKEPLRDHKKLLHRLQERKSL